MQVSRQDTEKLMGTLWHPTIKDDLYKFVMFSYPWGVKGTPLELHQGPRVWQRDELNRMTDAVGENKNRIQKGLLPVVYKSATCSGRGIGKSALIGWVSNWMMGCQLGSSTMVTANTQSQLVNKTFAEIGVWTQMFIASYWFERDQTKIKPSAWFQEVIKQRKIDPQYYYIDGVLWNADNPDAFAGAHNPRGFCLIYDEASGIPKPIWTVSEGFFTDISPYRFWLVFSNGRSNTGPFFECFHAAREYWYNRQIDSRTVEGLDHSVFNQIIQQYGEDSDEAQVEVKGGFPKQGVNQFISRKLVEDAQTRELDRYDDHAALVMGVDPARYGDDSTRITFRRGRDARSIPSIRLKGADNMQVANLVADLILERQPDAVFVDAGAGSGIIDRLKERGFTRIFEVWFGSEAQDRKWADHRTELWGEMREWLAGAIIAPASSEDGRALANDLSGPQYSFTGREERIKLEAKEEMKKRGLASPDYGDSLALTFHTKVLRRDRRGERPRSTAFNPHRKYKGSDYKVFG